MLARSHGAGPFAPTVKWERSKAELKSHAKCICALSLSLLFGAPFDMSTSISSCTPVNANARYVVCALFRVLRSGKTFMQLRPRQVALPWWRRLYWHLVHLLRVNATTKEYRRFVCAALSRVLNSRAARPSRKPVAESPLPAPLRLRRRVRRFVELADLFLASPEQYEEWAGDPCAEWKQCPAEEARMFRQDSVRIKKAFEKRADIASDLWLRDAYVEQELEGQRWNPRKERQAVLYVRHLLSKT